MNKAREQLAEMFLSCLQEERLPWNQPWVMDVPGFGTHHNPITGTRYRGVNAAMLWAMGLERQYQYLFNADCLTKEQICELLERVTIFPEGRMEIKLRLVDENKAGK